MTTPEGRAAVERHLQKGRGATQEMARAYFEGKLEGAPRWDKGPFAHDWYLRLTPDEAAEFDREYLELCFRWRDKIAARLEAGDTEGRETFAIFIHGFPLPKGVID